MSHINPFHAENPFWMRMGIFLIVVLIHPIYLRIKRISEGLILQKIWQGEKLFQWGLDAHLFLPILTHTGTFPHPERSHCSWQERLCLPLCTEGFLAAITGLLCHVAAPQGQGMEWGSSKNSCSQAKPGFGGARGAEQGGTQEGRRCFLSLSHFLQP